jgi:hypothetical protein
MRAGSAGNREGRRRERTSMQGLQSSGLVDMKNWRQRASRVQCEKKERRSESIQTWLRASLSIVISSCSRRVGTSPATEDSFMTCIQDYWPCQSRWEYGFEDMRFQVGPILPSRSCLSSLAVQQ